MKIVVDFSKNKLFNYKKQINIKEASQEGNPYILLKDLIIDHNDHENESIEKLLDFKLCIKNQYFGCATRDKANNKLDNRFIIKLSRGGIDISCIDSCDHKLKVLPIIRLSVNNTFNSEL